MFFYEKISFCFAFMADRKNSRNAEAPVTFRSNLIARLGLFQCLLIDNDYLDNVNPTNHLLLT